MERTLYSIMISNNNTLTPVPPSVPSAPQPTPQPTPQMIVRQAAPELKWTSATSFIFATCALLGVLLLIFSGISFAQPGGFRPGGPALGNPINDPEFDEDNYESDDNYVEDLPIQGNGGFNNSPTMNFPTPPSRNARSNSTSPGRISVGGAQDDKPIAQIKRAKKGFSASGPGTEKNIQSKNTFDTLTVDTESGDGIPANKELITDFNFPDADVMDIAKTLGRLTGKNFILDKEVSKGSARVSVISNSPITVSDAWRAFLTALDMNGLAIVPRGKYLSIMRQNDAKGKNVRMYSNQKAPNTDALVTKIFKIKYISAKELENVVRTYANMGARIYGFDQTNTLIITDTGSNIAKIAEMIKFLDVEGFDAGIEVMQVKYASATELSKLIDTLLPGTQAGLNRPGIGFPGGARPAQGNFSARKTKEGGMINTIIADERTNSLIVHANTRGAEQVRALVARLDRKMPATAGGGKVHVVYLQFADAEDMAKTLSNFSQGQSSGARSGGFSPGGLGGGIGINPNEGNLFEGQIKVSPDKKTNSLVITSSQSDFTTIQRVINKLDIPRDQVYVEIVIMEMNMERNNEFAANVLMPGSGMSVSPTSDLAKLIQNPAAVPNGLVLNYQSSNQTELSVNQGGTATKVKVPNVAALIKAIQTYANGNVLATPQLMTLDNTEAVFESTDKIPMPQYNSAGLGSSTVSITKESVPLSIKIKPQLNKISNFIKLDIKAKISDITTRNVPQAVENQAFATLERNAETSVVVADSDTVVLGGLTRDKSSEAINKVPLLGDIPILGWLFKSRSAKIEKTNLMLFITPKIIRQYESIRTVLDQKLKERDEFIDQALGGEDAHREQRNKIIRSLPDIKAISNYNTKQVVSLDDDDQESRTLTLPAADPLPPQMPSPAAPLNPPLNPPPAMGTHPETAPLLPEPMNSEGGNGF